MKIILLPIIVLGSMASGMTSADESGGRQTFENHCAECHAAGFGHPGTQRLGWSRGEKHAVLTRRTDLSAEYIKIIVRRGLIEMPPFRPSEISDSQLAGLSAYLTKPRVGAR